MNINPFTASDKLLEHFINTTRCPICEIDVSRSKLDEHIRQELSDDHVYGADLEDRILELKHEQI